MWSCESRKTCAKTFFTSVLFRRILKIESEIEKWKRDYVFLLQANITVPTGDLMDGLEVKMYGGDRVRTG